MVKTYDCTDGGAQHCYGCYTMRESTDGFGKSDEYGDWVRKVDYDALATETTTYVDALVEHRRALEAALDWIIDTTKSEDLSPTERLEEILWRARKELMACSVPQNSAKSGE